MAKTKEKEKERSAMSISSEEVNFLVLRYLQESGFSHSAFTFAYESQITKSTVADAQVAPGMLITFLQKGLAYVGIEEHLNEDGSERECDADFSLVKAHVCGVNTNGSQARAPRGMERDHRGHRDGKGDPGVGGAGGGRSVGVSSGPKDGSNGSGAGSGSNSGGGAGGGAGSGAGAAAAGGAAADSMEVDTGEEGGVGNDGAGGVGEGVQSSVLGAGGRGGGSGAGAVTSVAATGATPTITPDEVAVLTNHCSEVFMCAWNPKMDLLASGSGDSTARIWKVPNHARGASITEEVAKTSIVLKHSEDVGDKNKDVTTLEWNKSGTLLATGSYDGVARIWSNKGVLKHTLEAHEGPIFSLKWNAKGNYLLSGSSDKSAIVWEANNGEVKQQFRFHEAPTLDVDWKDDVTFATCSTDKAIHILIVGEEYPRQTFTGHMDEVNAIKWDPTGTLLASCSDDYTAKIWKMGQTSCVHSLEEHTKEIYTIKWSPRPERKPLLASASFDATVKLWDVEVGKVVSTLARHEDPVYSVAFSPSGDYLVSGSFAGHLYVWNVKDGALIKSYQGEGDIFEVAWNHREDRIAACFSTSSVAVIDFRM